MSVATHFTYNLTRLPVFVRDEFCQLQWYSFRVKEKNNNSPQMSTTTATLFQADFITNKPEEAFPPDCFLVRRV